MPIKRDGLYMPVPLTIWRFFMCKTQVVDRTLAHP
jgi:hypothetical protein